MAEKKSGILKNTLVIFIVTLVEIGRASCRERV